MTHIRFVFQCNTKERERLTKRARAGRGLQPGAPTRKVAVVTRSIYQRERGRREGAPGWTLKQRGKGTFAILNGH